jgi:proteasome accessory factor B
MEIRDEVAGYPENQDYEAFIRMFERDKEALKAMGFAVRVVDNAYELDTAETYAALIDLTPAETATVRIAGSALIGDPSFPHHEPLRLALAKISAEVAPVTTAASTRLADEDPERQGESVSALWAAAEARKRVSFGYTNSRGASAPHEVEPLGLFVHDGRWYLVGRDTARDELRTYAVARMTDLAPNTEKPRHPDFERPEGFDVRSFVSLPFQYGEDAEEFIATLRFTPDDAWRAPALAAGHGALTEMPDGSTVWEVRARDAGRLVRFVTENGPGLSLVAPSELIERTRTGLSKVVALHG